MNNQPSSEGRRTNSSVGGSAEDISEGFRNVGRAVSDVTQQAVDGVYSASEDLLEQAKSTGKQGVDQVGRYVKSEPIKAILLSAGVGLLVGLLLKRR